MIRSGFGSRIRTVGRVSGGIGEGRCLRTERSVNLVCGDVQEAKGRPSSPVHLPPIFLSLLQKRKRAIYVGLNKFPWTSNRTIDVALGCKMDQARGFEGLEQLPHEAAVIDVALRTMVPVCFAEVFKISCSC